MAGLFKALWLSLATAAVAGLLLLGCGDGEDNGSDNATGGQGGANGSVDNTDGDGQGEVSSTPADKRIAKKAFVKQGNEICEATVGTITAEILPPLEELEKEGKTSESDRAALEEELVTTVAVPELRNEVEEIQALGSPSGDARQVEAILSSFIELIEKAENDPQVLTGSNQAFAKPANLAERYGLDSCPYG